MYDPQPLGTSAGWVWHGGGAALAAVDGAALTQAWRGSGLVLLRGFAGGVAGFAGLTRRLLGRFKHTPVHRGTHALYRHVQTVTPGATPMGFHAEYTHLPDAVQVIAFFTQMPTGNTRAVDGVALWKALEPAAQKHLERHRLAYQTWHDPAAWVAATGTTDVAEVQRATASIADYTVTAGPGGGLITRYVRSAFHLHGGQPCLVANIFPDAYAALMVTQEDGQPLPESVMAAVHQAAERVAVDLQPQPDDVLVLDNLRWMHARGPQGPGRKAWAVLGWMR